MSVLNSISTPADLRKLSIDELTQLAGEIRHTIVQGVSTNGGHLASNLGVTELTLALHYVYDFGPFPTGPDLLVFDVGHQCYPHKIITGRAAQFERLRKKGSVSGFPSPEESPYDLFSVGHAGTAISTAVGLARAGTHLKDNGHVVAMVGDASIVNGLAFEGLNNAGTLKRQLLVVLNDNGMSISRPQGAFGQYLERIRVSTTYDEFKRISEKLVHRLPGGMQQTIENAWHAFCDGVKGVLYPGQIFESIGIKYMGPVDGHDLPGLLNFLAEIKHVNRPVVLHVKTVKGHGYELAASEPTRFHSPAAFQVNGCRVETKPSARSWTAAFADAMIDAARRDTRLIALTAAMPDGTGLSKFEKEFPARYYDTGICESHLTAMAAGMAKRGLRPVAAIYSTFLQRAFDQAWQEVVLNHVPVIFALDRAGFVGDDGAVHHGFMDLAFLRPMPEIVLMAPSDEAELRRALKLALTLDTASAFRYPRDSVPAKNFHEIIAEDLRAAASADWTIGQSRVLRSGDDATLIVYGALAETAMTAAADLEQEGISVAVIDARFCKPLDGAMLADTLRAGHPVLTLEDHALANGFGSAVLEHAVTHRLPVANLYRLGMPDRMISHATRPQQLAEVGLDSAGIAQSIRDAIRDATATAPARGATPIFRTVAREP
jgi:1-deoxy-D-xylulose-5-phosphate synthase